MFGRLLALIRRALRPRPRRIEWKNTDRRRDGSLRAQSAQTFRPPARR